MRIIKRSAIIVFWEKHNQSKEPLEDWYRKTEKAKWLNIGDVRLVYPHADLVTVDSGNTVVVFNIGGNKYRLITAIHYNTGIVYVLDIMTHAEYSKNEWKERF